MRSISSPVPPFNLCVVGLLSLFMLICPWLSMASDSPAETSIFPLTLTDSAEQKVSLDKPPQRIVVIGRGPFMTIHMLYMFPEIQERLVGYENRSQELKNFLALLDPKVNEKTELGMNPGIEQIFALKPDLIVKKAYFVDKMASLLMQAGISVLHVGLETPERFYEDMLNIGRVLGNLKRAEEIVDFYKVRLNRITQRVASIPDNQKARILILHLDGRSSTSAMRIPPETWMQTIQTKLAGADPIWLDAHPNPSGWNVVNFEQIAAWDADKIFIIIKESADTEQILTDLKNHTLWKQLKAVKNNYLIPFPSDAIGWDSPEPRWILGTTWIALQSYPDLFKDISMKNEVNDFFSFLYNLEQSKIDSGIWPGITLYTHDNP